MAPLERAPLPVLRAGGPGTRRLGAARGAVKDPLDEYAAVVERVDLAAAAIVGRCGAAIACVAGCEACCHVELTLALPEADAVRRALLALDVPARSRIAARAAATQDDRCVMLEDGATCAIYAARPLVCRTQGLPLAYPRSEVSEESRVAETERSAIICCPLCFSDAPPNPRDALDAEQVDVLLAVVTRRLAERRGADPLARVSLRALVREVGA